MMIALIKLQESSSAQITFVWFYICYLLPTFFRSSLITRCEPRDKDIAPIV